MLSFNKILFIGFTALFLTGCQTLSSGDIRQQTQADLDRIQIQSATSRLDQLFLRQLDDSLNQNPALRDLDLRTDLNVSSSSTLSVRGKSSNLSKTTMTVNYQLTDRLTKDVITSGSLKATATSGTVSSYFGQEQSQKFTSERLGKTLADRLVQKLRLYFLTRDKG